MSSISSVSSSSSIYGNRNVISGLASGMDTESMIENAISGYQTKIANLQKKRTKTEWQQEAYRSIIDKMAAFTEKYTSYRSNTNLMSTSFFNQAVNTISKGENASKVAASGRGGSDVVINRVKQLATAARYTVSGGIVGGRPNNADGLASATATDSIDLNADVTVSKIAGTMNIAYGGNSSRTTLSIDFGEMDTFANASEMAAFINKQLDSQSISTNSGTSKKASEMIQARANNGVIELVDVSGGSGNDFYISSASKNIQDVLGLKPGSGVRSISVGDTELTEEINTADYLNNADLKITLDGVTKTIKMPSSDELQKYMEENPAEEGVSEAEAKSMAYVNLIQQKLDDAFGTFTNADGQQESKFKVSNANAGTYDADKIKLSFTSGQKASSFEIRSDKSKAMGLGENGLNSYMKTSQTLKDLLGEDGLKNLKSEQQVKKDANGMDVTDDSGNPVYETVYSFEINGVEIGKYTEDTALATIMNNINSNSKAGVSVSYSKNTNEFTFTSKNTGAAEKITFGEEGSLSNAIFGNGSFREGQDAIFGVSINGGEEMELTRSSNTAEFDGLNVTLKGTFGYDEVEKEVPDTDADGNPVLDADGNPVMKTVKELVKSDKTEGVTFETTANADKLVDTIRSMVEDYNAMVTEIKNAYSTLPIKRSSGAYYEPLTDDDMADMSESAIAAWEEKAKTGLLFGDSDLSSLYKRLTSAVSMTGTNGDALKAAGITLSYSNGLTTMQFDEQTLRNTLNEDPDKVRDIFTKSAEDGSSTNGLMQALKTPLDLYGATTGTSAVSGTKGVLVNKAGSLLAPSTLYTNTIQKQLNKIDEEIEKWQDKMSDQVDYYTTQFSRLEQLISQMNSQSSSIMSMMGGY